MLHSEMNQFLQGFGPATSLASGGCSEQHFLLKHQNSFEDEVESIYFSDLKKQQQEQDAKMAASVSLATSAPATGLGVGGMAAGGSSSFSTTDGGYFEGCEFQMVRPEEVTGQTIAPVKLEDSEDDVIKANFDLSTLLDQEDDLIDMTGGEEEEDVVAEGDKTIAEMQEFLGRFEEEEAPAADDDFVVTMPIQQESESSTSVLPDNLAEELLSMEQRHTLESMETKCPDLTDYNAFQAEMLLDMLLETVPDHQQMQQQPVAKHQTDILQEAMLSQNLHDSGFMDQEEDGQVVVDETATAITLAAAAAVPAATIPRTYNVSNVSEFQTADGKKVIIVIQPAAAATASPAVVHQQQQLPAVTEDDSSSDVVVEDSDSDWTPEVSASSRSNRATTSSSKRRPGRKPEARASVPVTQDGRVTKRSYRGVKDRKERKKMQNVEAARRYRDKKKAEQSEMEEEERILMERNKELKNKLADVENEFKTMKKLMVELGLNFVK